MKQLPVFELQSLIVSLSKKGFESRVGSADLDVHPARRAYFDRWLDHRDGFIRMLTGNVDFVGIEEIVRMGPFFDVYCVIENDFVADNDENAHRLFDARPYYQLRNGKVASMGWSGGVIATLLAKDDTLSADFAKNIMSDEVKKISITAANYCCVIETKVWDPEGLAAAFGIIDRIAMTARKLVKQIHLGEKVET